MKIVKLSAENIKKLRVVEITPDGAIVQITGPNASGKSSVLDSIYYAIAGGKLPKQPIRRGETSAKVMLDLGEFVVTRKFTEAGSTLTVEAASGARIKSPQHLMDSLASSISLDPLAFARAEPKEQFDMLRSVVKLDIDLDALAGQNQKDYEARTEANREARAARVRIAVIPDEGMLPAKIDPDDLMKKMEDAGNHNRAVVEEAAARTRYAGEITSKRNQVSVLHQRIAGLTRQMTEAQEEADKITGQANSMQDLLDDKPEVEAPIDTAKIREELAEAQRINNAIARQEQRAAIVKDAERYEGLAKSATDRMAVRDAAKAEAIAAVKMPIPDIAIGDGVVLYKGLPFEQASDAERLRVSAAIAMAGNPKLRVLRIKEGSLLDSKGLQLLREMAEAQDYQVWVEAVDESGKVGIVMEDGAVVAHVEGEERQV